MKRRPILTLILMVLWALRPFPAHSAEYYKVVYLPTYSPRQVNQYVVGATLYGPSTATAVVSISSAGLVLNKSSICLDSVGNDFAQVFYDASNYAHVTQMLRMGQASTTETYLFGEFNTSTWTHSKISGSDQLWSKGGWDIARIYALTFLDGTVMTSTAGFGGSSISTGSIAGQFVQNAASATFNLAGYGLENVGTLFGATYGFTNKLLLGSVDQSTWTHDTSGSGADIITSRALTINGVASLTFTDGTIMYSTAGFGGGGSYWVGTATSALNMAGYDIYGADIVTCNTSSAPTIITNNITFQAAAGAISQVSTIAGWSNDLSMVGHMHPNVNGLWTLGTTTYRWGTACLGSGGLNFSDSTTLTSTAALLGWAGSLNRIAYYDSVNHIGYSTAWNVWPSSTQISGIVDYNGYGIINSTSIMVSSNATDAYPTIIRGNPGGSFTITKYQPTSTGVKLSFMTDYLQLTDASGVEGIGMVGNSFDAFGVLNLGFTSSTGVVIGHSGTPVLVLSTPTFMTNAVFAGNVQAASVNSAGQVTSNGRKLVDTYECAVNISSPYSLGAMYSSATLISPFRSFAVTITTMVVRCVGGTSVTGHVAQRDVAVPNSTGTVVWTALVSASSNAWTGGTFNDNTVPAGSGLFFVPGVVTGNVDWVWVTYTYTKD